MDSFTKLNSVHNFIKSFFVKTVEKETWKFWTWMTDHDRTRVDLNTDQLRQNDEKLEYDIEHQSIALDKIYDVINITSVQADIVSQQIMQNFENLRQVIKKKINKIHFRCEENIVSSIYFTRSYLLDRITNKLNQK